MSEVSIGEYEQQSGVDFEKFITRVWEHPLLSPETSRFRTDFSPKFTNWMKAIQIDSADYFALPVGSIVWTTNSESDYDVVLGLDSSVVDTVKANTLGGRFDFNIHSLDFSTFDLIDDSIL